MRPVPRSPLSLSLVALGAVLTAAALLPAAASAQATPVGQVTRGWELCFTSGVLSCTQLTLTTTPRLFAGTRYGTMFDIALSYAEHGAWRSALQDVTLGFASDPADYDARGPVSTVDFGAPGGSGGSASSMGWVQYATSAPDDPARSYLLLTSHPSQFGLPELVPAPPYYLPQVHYIGGCGVGAADGVVDDVVTTTMWTCGTGSAYRTSFFSLATLDADRVTSLGVDAYRAYPGSGDPLAPFCTAQTDGSGSVGTAEGDFSDFGDVCTVRALGPETSTPEPASVWLVAVGLVGLPLLRRAWARGASA